DFLGCANADRSGTGSNALYYPLAEQKKSRSTSDLYDLEPDKAEKDGSISMRTEELQGNSPHFQDSFDKGSTLGIPLGEAPPEFGPIFSNGAWLKTRGALKYQFHDVFPPSSRMFTVGMWICLNLSDPNDTTDKTILVVDKIGTNNEPIVFKIVDQKLCLRLVGTTGTIGGQPVRMLPEGGDNPVPRVPWRHGEWHWIGFRFEEAGGDNDNSKATIFATKIKEDGTHELEESILQTSSGQKMFLYKAQPANFVKFGSINAIVDDIYVTTDHDSFLPDTRFKKGTYSSPKTIFSLSDEEKELPIQLGTISWTEYLTSKCLPAGKADFDPGKDHYSDVHVSASTGSATGSEAGTGENNKPLSQIPVWFSHDDLLAGLKDDFRIGKCGEGQRLGKGRGSVPPTYWTGYSDSARENATAKGSDKIQVSITLNGPGDGPSATRPSFEAPYVDDITITYFKDLELLYWKVATDPAE
ncbi:MAG: hypothetical protein HQ592_14810, partial [Planctomycetes bacterium]|nr:hypothetical protein [Planctomycetota bacterium]